jgi:hypothetical protein
MRLFISSDALAIYHLMHLLSNLMLFLSYLVLLWPPTNGNTNKYGSLSFFFVLTHAVHSEKQAATCLGLYMRRSPEIVFWDFLDHDRT